MPQILMGSARRSGVAVSRDGGWTDRLAPNARFVAGELALWAALYGAYLGLRAIAIAGESRAFRNAHHVIGAERALGLSHEAAAQRALHPAEPLLFDLLHAGLRAADPDRAGVARVEAPRPLSLPAHRAALLDRHGRPGAPDLPRRATAARRGPRHQRLGGALGGHDTGSFAGIRFNPYAAMPSMHVGWSLLVGIVAWRALPGRLRALGLLHPAMMTLAVTATGNHYLLDAIGGAAVAMAGLAVAGLLSGAGRSGSGRARRTGSLSMSRVRARSSLIASGCRPRTCLRLEKPAPGPEPDPRGLGRSGRPGTG